MSQPIGSPGGSALRTSKKQQQLNIATWNVRGLLKPGKCHILEDELDRHNISIAGISETHWQESGHYKTSNNNTIYFSGVDSKSFSGVAFVVAKHLNKYILGYNCVSDRIISIKLNTKPIILNIVQVYAPTSKAEDSIVDDFYSSLQDTINDIPNREQLIIIGDFNAKVGETLDNQHIKNVIGRFGLGDRNDRGDTLIEFCISNNLTISNTTFANNPRRLYTWQSPCGKYRNQIDYILIRSRWRSSILNAKTYPGADCGSDHKLLIALLQTKLKAPCIRPVQARKPMPDLTMLETNSHDDLQHLMENVHQHTSANSLWIETKSIIDKASKKSPPKNTEQIRKPWITMNTWRIIVERRDLARKTMSLEHKRAEHKRLSRLIQKSCREDKNKYLQNMCQELQTHADHNHTKDIFTTIKTITRRFEPRTWRVRDESGVQLTDISLIVKRWGSYCESLFRGQIQDSRTLYHIDYAEEEPSILRSEVENAIKRLKFNKAAGGDGITAEVISALGENGTSIFHILCQQIWTSGEWPEEWTNSILLPFFKKGTKDNCENYRLIAIISHASKILLHIINERLKPYINWQIPQEQAGFVTGKGTREQIFNLRQIIEKAREFNIPVFMCFVDYTKAFDSICWQQLWQILIEMGVPRHLVYLLYSLYANNTSVVRVDNHLSDPFNIEKGTRQGCIISPKLFNIYGEYIMRKVLDNWDGGISINGTKISNLRFADDITLLATNAEELEEIIYRLESESRQYGLNINYNKTKIMIIDRPNNNRPDVRHIANCEVVKKFIYLGSMISNDGSCSPEIRRRAEIARRAASNLTKIWKDRNITKTTKIMLMNSLVFPVFLYASETWVMKKIDVRKIDAFEMWCWRRLLRIPWTARRTNDSVLTEVDEPIRLSKIIYSRIARFFGHVQRRDPDNLERLVVQGKVQGARSRGRSPKRWTDQIKEVTGCSLDVATRKGRNRSRWRGVIKKILNPQ